MKFARVVSAASLLATTTVLAQEPAATVGDMSCYTKPAFEELILGDKVRINNFSISERKGFLKRDLTVIEVSFSVANRDTTEAHLTGQFLLMGDKGPIAALTARPMFDMVGAGKTETAKGDAYVLPGTLERTLGICIQVIGNF